MDLCRSPMGVGLARHHRRDGPTSSFGHEYGLKKQRVVCSGSLVVTRARMRLASSAKHHQRDGRPHPLGPVCMDKEPPRGDGIFTCKADPDAWKSLDKKQLDNLWKKERKEDKEKEEEEDEEELEKA